MGARIAWAGRIISVQPRIVLMRSFDERSHSYLGYVLRLDGTIGGEDRHFLIAIGKAAHAKHQFRLGDTVSGTGEPVVNPDMETADLYKVSTLRLLDRAIAPPPAPPPWVGVPPDLKTYRGRGHRRLNMRTYETKCQACLWGCRMPVEMVIDQWRPEVRRYRFETFCYGPKSCPFYAAGAARKAPGRKGMVYEELDWVDEEATRHRGDDE
ncbi:MAG: hypothetical protein NTW96_25635 [Planctomycetia bacterium]|nr:hypothetical protein [Planctomycetia bacterium]